eukprot:Amastigsp_a676328_761.p3 type:complete len:105 gc:universal Amastigsp_a676328_761:131-445(+)
MTARACAPCTTTTIFFSETASIDEIWCAAASGSHARTTSAAEAPCAVSTLRRTDSAAASNSARLTLCFGSHASTPLTPATSRARMTCASVPKTRNAWGASSMRT